MKILSVEPQNQNELLVPNPKKTTNISLTITRSFELSRPIDLENRFTESVEISSINSCDLRIIPFSTDGSMIGRKVLDWTIVLENGQTTIKSAWSNLSFCTTRYGLGFATSSPRAEPFQISPRFMVYWPLELAQPSLASISRSSSSWLASISASSISTSSVSGIANWRSSSAWTVKSLRSTRNSHGTSAKLEGEVRVFRPAPDN
ncbi:MAG: hypothetical protein ORO03_02850 [Alphaproteobacteria bacterium]|nr:hypothetical protein [Alphaproteobacteria bacterium]